MMIKKFLRLAAIIGTLPNTISNGQTADAVPLMADLNWIVNQVNANATASSGVALLAAANTFTLVQSGPSATALANYPTAQQVQNVSFNTLSSIAGSTTITANAPLSMNAYADGQVFSFMPVANNNPGATLNINSIFPGSLYKNGRTLLGTNDLQTNRVSLIRYDGGGSGFQLLNPPQAAAVLSEVFTSGSAVITAAGSLTIAHGLAGRPTLFQPFLHCTATDAGYSPNMIVPVTVATGASGLPQALTLVPDNTNINVRFGSTSPPFTINAFGTGAATVLTISAWSFRISAWR